MELPGLSALGEECRETKEDSTQTESKEAELALQPVLTVPRGERPEGHPYRAAVLTNSRERIELTAWRWVIQEEQGKDKERNMKKKESRRGSSSTSSDVESWSREIGTR